MGNVMNVVFAEEINSDDPGARHNDLVDPATVLKNFRSLQLIHHNLPLLFNCLLVSADTHDQIGVREELFGLFENLGMANVIHVEYTIGIHSNRVVGVSSVGHSGTNNLLLNLWGLLLHWMLN
jgi:hypothetical protein